jgi:hypothetical protein
MPEHKPITKLYIPNLEKNVTHQMIVDTFRKLDLAHIDVSNVNIKRSHGYLWRDSHQFLEASITLSYWHDSEAAYTFIQSLRTGEWIKLVFNEYFPASFWLVKENRPSPKKNKQNKESRENKNIHLPNKEHDDLDMYLNEVNLARNILAYEEDNWMADKHVFEEYQREIYALSQSLLMQ